MGSLSPACAEDKLRGDDADSRSARDNSLPFRLLNFSTANRRNKARMYMKTKDKYKKSGSRDGEKLLTRLAILAAPSPKERAADKVWSGTRASARNTRIVGTNSIKSFSINKSHKKRTQNELDFEHQMRESSSNSEVAWHDGKKPLAWLATLANLSPRGEDFDRVRISLEEEAFLTAFAFYSLPAQTGGKGREIQKSWEQTQ